MKGVIRVLALILVLGCLSGCADKATIPHEESDGSVTDEKIHEDNSDVQTYKECLFTEDDETIEENLSQYENRLFSGKDVFYITHFVTEDTSLWDQFVEESAAGKESEIIIGQPTIEGDVIYSYLYFTGEHYYMGIDNSRDKFRGTDGFYSCVGFFLQLDRTDVPSNEIGEDSGEYERVIAYLTQLDYSAIKMEPGQVYNLPVEFGVCSFIRKKD